MIEEHGVPEAEIVKESGHCLHPNFLRQQVEASLERLNLTSLDVCYLQNPYEAQGPYHTDNVFFDRLAAAFETMEELVQEGKIGNYGMATYSSFRVKPTDHKMHLSLQKVNDLACKIGGEKTHHMRYLQVPINVMMPEAFVEPFQIVRDKGSTEDSIVERPKILIGCCTDFQINVVGAQPLLQGLVANLPLSKIAVPDIHNL